MSSGRVISTTTITFSLSSVARGFCKHSSIRLMLFVTSSVQRCRRLPAHASCEEDSYTPTPNQANEYAIIG
ncbi:hypothetical protein DM02DRAFT_611154 [Periconia macrospinosa]|uniref:Uncharacterized protein n=1 Tax=Periconia macrospinosa TaxID=97972 RepID=A0A2V1E2I5_9PLEO|nr:hypothetical protein DM02DRAFT_611154 [Periconia macrospinosa]